MSGLHSGSLAMRQVFPVSRQQAMLLHCGLALLLGITRFDYRVLPVLDWVGALLPSALVVILLNTAVPLSPRLSRTAWWLGAAAGATAKLLGSQAHLAIGAGVAVVVFFAAWCVAKKSQYSLETRKTL
jgi:ABC-type Mn2+/Zn2+ transport system permease subunit